MSSASKLTKVHQSAREIPVIAKVDLVISGATSAAIAAAEAASKAGADVFLIAPRPYLGEDLCANLRFESDKKRTQPNSLKRVFSSLKDTEISAAQLPYSSLTTPAQVKSVLREARTF